MMNKTSPFITDAEFRRQMERVAMENERNKRDVMESHYRQRRDFYAYGYGDLVRTERMDAFARVDPGSPYRMDDMTMQEQVKRREKLQDSTQVQLDSHFFTVDIPQLNQNN